MTNAVYEKAIAELGKLFGSPHDLESGNGTRFTSASKGRVTVYHREIGTGNQAELAFEVETLGKRMKETPNGVRTLITKLRTMTGRATDPNAQHGWPRVGLSTADHVAEVCAELDQRLKKAKS